MIFFRVRWRATYGSLYFVVAADSEEDAREIVKKEVGSFPDEDKITTVERLEPLEKGVYIHYHENHLPNAK